MQIPEKDLWTGQLQAYRESALEQDETHSKYKPPAKKPPSKFDFAKAINRKGGNKQEAEAAAVAESESGKKASGNATSSVSVEGDGDAFKARTLLEAEDLMKAQKEGKDPQVLKEEA